MGALSRLTNFTLVKKIVIEGRLSNKRYDYKEGQKLNLTEVIVNELLLL